MQIIIRWKERKTTSKVADNVLMSDTRCSPGITHPLLFIPPRQGDLPYSNVCKNLPVFRGRGVLAARWQSVNCVMVCLYEIGLLLRSKRERGDGSQMQFSPCSHSNADHLNMANRVYADPVAFLLPHLHCKKVFAGKLRMYTRSRCARAGKPACIRPFSLQRLIIFGIISRLHQTQSGSMQMYTSTRKKYLFSTAM